MADVLSNYRTGDAFDEMMDGEGSVRPSYQAVYSALSRSTSDDLRMIAESLGQQLHPSRRDVRRRRRGDGPSRSIWCRG